MNKQEEIITKLSEKYNLPEYKIKAIIESPFRLMSDELEKKSLKNFHIKFFGKFAMTRGRQAWVQENVISKLKPKDEQAKGNS